jgi:membrane protein
MNNKIIRIIEHSFLMRSARRVMAWSQRIVLPGFDGMPLYDVGVFFFKGLFKGYITNRASSIAFNFFLALPPLIIFFFTIIPFVPVKDFHTTLVSLIEEVMPKTTYETINATLVDIITRPRGGLLSVGFLLTLFFATSGFDSMMGGFNSTYHALETRSWIKQKLVSILLVLITCVIIIISITLIIFGTFLLDFLTEEHLLRGRITWYLLAAAKWVVLLATYFFSISFIYYLAPAKQRAFRFISAGSTLATVLSLAAFIGFNIYVMNFSRYNVLYGSIGTLLIILLWIYFNSLILLIGFELNASIYSAGLEKKNGGNAALQEPNPPDPLPEP